MAECFVGKSAHPMPARPSLLVLDSSAFVLSYLRSLTARRDFSRIESATTATQAWSHLGAGGFDVCVLGAGASGEDVTDMARRIRRHLPPPANKVCIIVALDDPTAAKVRAAISAGVDEVILRPYTQDMLVKRIEHALANRRDFVTGRDYIGPCRRRKVAGSLLHAPRRRAGDHSPRQGAKQPRSEVEVLLARAGDRISSALDRTEGLSIIEIYDAASLAHHCAQCLDAPRSTASIRQLLEYLEQHGASLDFDIETVRSRARTAAAAVAHDLQGLAAVAHDALSALKLTDSLSVRAHAARRGDGGAPVATGEGADAGKAAAAHAAMLSRQVVQEHLQRRVRQH